MSQALWIAKTGLDAQQTKMSNIANNLANAGTTGFKASRAIFADLLYQNVRQVGAQTSQDTELPSGLSLGTGVRTVATERLFTQGNLQKTENSLDMAIQGRGFDDTVFLVEVFTVIVKLLSLDIQCALVFLQPVANRLCRILNNTDVSIHIQVLLI